ncbi:hypothetical protein HS125_14550 [bacterium]|nr:hypothetical protein [bacterium]
MKRLGVLLTAAMLCTTGVWAQAGATGEMTQKTCPMMKEPIDGKVYLDYHGYRLYTCCKDCQKKATADPMKAMRGLAALGETPQRLGQLQTTCPMTGGKVSGQNLGVVDGMRVDFCCGSCEKKFDAMSRADKLAVIDKMVAGGQVPTLLVKAQTTCPVMGGSIDKAVYVDVEGERTYFCCPGCKGKYTTEKAAMDKKMAAEGVGLEKAPPEGDKKSG